jgi:hypothetical protein
MSQNTATFLQPVAWGSSPTLTPAPCLPSNPTRSGVIFINSGTVQIAICPQTEYIGTITYNSTTQTYTVPVASAGVPAINGAGSVTMNPGDKFIFDNLACGIGWNAVAAAATGGAITIFEFL